MLKQSGLNLLSHFYILINFQIVNSERHLLHASRIELALHIVNILTECEAGVAGGAL